jgi:hypothetical protein
MQRLYDDGDPNVPERIPNVSRIQTTPGLMGDPELRFPNHIFSIESADEIEALSRR